MYEPHTGFRQPMRGVAGAAAVVAFAIVFLILAATYLGDAREAREEACATTNEIACDGARRDRDVATLVTVGAAVVAAGGTWSLTRRIAPARAS